MIRTNIVNMTPNEISTDGYLKVKEINQPMIFRFVADENFRGTLSEVAWNLDDDVIHTITPEDEDFSEFVQVGERPQVCVNSSWLFKLGIKAGSLVRIKFSFDTFRMEPYWYAYLYITSVYGDGAESSDAAYLVDTGKQDGACAACPKCDTCRACKRRCST